MGLGLEMAQTLGLIPLSWETWIVLGSPKDRCREKPKLQLLGHTPKRGCPTQFANFVAISSLVNPCWFCSTLQNLQGKVSCPCCNSELSFPKRHLPVTGLCYSTSRQKLQ